MHETKSVSYRRPFNDANGDIALNPPDPSYPNSRTFWSGTAYSADARFKEGLMLRGEGMSGDDRLDYVERYGARTL